ncbi:MAG: LPS assembly lipoprotein LptE [Acidobacteria bacterium]|nr:LPS assembly lipoprotein LptE [Acidobacteriota bacterium]
MMNSPARHRPPAASVGWVLTAVLTTFLGGCGYHLVGTSSFLPAEYKTLYVATLDNQTDRADMDQRVTEALTREWVRRRRFQLVDHADRADLVLKGVIRSVSVAPVRFDEQGRATEYQMTLTVSAQLLTGGSEKPKVLWEDKNFSRRTSYDVDVSAADYFDRQIEAMDRVSEDLARALVSAVLEGF